jgi:hypothetical protein
VIILSPKNDLYNTADLPVCFSVEEIKYESEDITPGHTHAIVMWPGMMTSRTTNEGEPLVVGSFSLCEHVMKRMFQNVALGLPCILRDFIIELDPECIDPENVAEACSVDPEKQTVN